jgi:hypothetical protein
VSAAHDDFMVHTETLKQVRFMSFMSSWCQKDRLREESHYPPNA